MYTYIDEPPHNSTQAIDKPWKTNATKARHSRTVRHGHDYLYAQYHSSLLVNSSYACTEYSVHTSVQVQPSPKPQEKATKPAPEQKKKKQRATIQFGVRPVRPIRQCCT